MTPSGSRSAAGNASGRPSPGLMPTTLPPPPNPSPSSSTSRSRGGSVADSREASFGRLAQGATGPQELLETEAAHGRAERFAALDALVGRLAIRSLSGEVPFRIEGTEEALSTGRSATIRLGGLDDDERLVLDDQYS